MALLVRASTEDDIGVISRIYGHFVSHSSATFELTPPNTAEMARRRAEALKLGYPHLVAEADGEVAGFAYVTAYRPRKAYRYTVEDWIYADPEAAEAGCGEALLQVLIEQCGQGPWRQIVSVIGSEDEAGIHMREQMGFRQVGTLRGVGFKFNQWVDTVIMQRELGNGSRVP